VESGESTVDLEVAGQVDVDQVWGVLGLFAFALRFLVLPAKVPPDDRDGVFGRFAFALILTPDRDHLRWPLCSR
jgi:hypothetical protein